MRGDEKTSSRLLLIDLIDEHLLPGDLIIEELAFQFEQIIERLHRNPTKDADRASEKLEVLFDLFDRQENNLVYRYMINGQKTGKRYHTFVLSLHGVINEMALRGFNDMIAAHLYLALNGPSRITFSERERLSLLLQGSGRKCYFCDEMFLFPDELALHQKKCSGS
jgi:hypothetical protein